MRSDLDEGNEGRIDLSPLDPTLEGEGMERMLLRIRAVAAAELGRRSAALGPGDLIVLWRVPVLASAGLLAVAATLILLLAGRPTASADGTLAEALGIPSSCAEWVQTGERPTPGELLDAGGATP